jgi:hypothetical protein
MSDSPNIGDQSALTTSRGRIWLVAGGILALVCVGVLIPLIWMEPPGAAVGGIVGIAVVYAAMILVRLFVRRLRPRLITMATLMSLTAVVFFVAAGIVYFTGQSR